MASEPIADPPPDVRTIADLSFHVLGRFQKPLLVGRAKGGQIEGLSGKELFENARDLSLGFTALGMRPGERVALVAESRPEWLEVDLAILTAGAVTVPIYPTLSAGQIRYILEDSAAAIAVVSTRLQLEKIQEIRHQLPSLHAVVVMDPAAAANASPSVLSLDEVRQRGHGRMMGEWGAGREYKETARAIQPSKLATIIYTSGTTGEPKGVMLTHGALVSNLVAAARVLDVSQDDVGLSFLPLSHAFERMVAWVYLYCGVTVIFAESFDTVARDIGLVRPTIFTGVPRVYEKLYDRVMEKGQTGSGFSAAVFRWAIDAGKAVAHETLRGSRPGLLQKMQARLADRLVYEKIRAGLGGRIRYLVSGSAPLGADTAEFFSGIGLPIVEGYGLTETAPILTVNPPDALRVGTVGKPIPGVDVRVADDGELVARGPNLMSGYYNKPEATADAIKDGWFHTGDVGTIDAEGYITITDRKKDLLVTSGGKKIAPQPIEATLARSPLVAEAVVLGDRRNYAAALIVPNFRELERRLQALGRPPASRDELVVRDDVRALYQEIVNALNRELSQFERIKRIALLPAEFTIESGELTPSLKVKRKVVLERWKQTIEDLYAE